jgi:group I intron endonuclease
MAELNMKTYIYLLKDPTTLQIRYVGKTTCLKRRFKSHKCLKATKGTYLSSWIVSMRNRSLLPLIEIIDVVEGCDWKEKESYYIELYKNKGCDLVNLTSGGEGCEGYKHTDENKKKMSKIQKEFWKKGIHKFIPSYKGCKHSDSERKNISQRQLGELNHNYGKKTPDHIREKISKKLGIEIEINNIKYPSLRQAAKSLNIQWGTFKYRYKMGLKLV